MIKTPPEPGVTVVLMPVYEDRISATLLLRDLASYCPDANIVVVEDGSLVDPLTAIAVREAGLSGRVITLRRNVGHQQAIAVGIAYIAENIPEARRVVVMDSDGEDDPKYINEMLSVLEGGCMDVVVAARRKRSEAVEFRIWYACYKWVFRLLTGRTISFGNYVVLSSRSVRRLAAMQELWLHLAATILVSRLRVGVVLADRGQRYSGKTRMSFLSLVLHGMRSIVVMGEFVLVRVGIACMAVFAATVLLLVTSLVIKLTGFATPGWFTSAVGSLIVILMQATILSFVTLLITVLLRNTPPMSKAKLSQLIEAVEAVEVSQRRSKIP